MYRNGRNEMLTIYTISEISPQNQLNPQKPNLNPTIKKV